MREIAAVIDVADPEQLPPGTPDAYLVLQQLSLGSGAAGIALLHAELAAATGEEREAACARSLTDRCANALAEITMGPDLLGGFSGLAWAVETVERRLESATGDLAAEVDEALAAYVSSSPWAGEYDLVSGLVGFGVYGLARLPSPAARTLLASVLDRLEELATPAGDGVAWRTPPERMPPHQLAAYPNGCWNVGLAHGAAGAVALLAGLLEAGIEPARTAGLLREAVRWLLSRRLNGSPSFPALFDESLPPAPTRLAWCYGDPGVALALLKAGAALGEAGLVATGLDVARDAAAQPPKRSGVVDAGLCHGAAGLAHIYNRIHQASGEETFAIAARHWLEATLSFRRPGEPVAGIAAWQTQPEPHWAPTPGLVNGAAGVGLMLTSALYGVEPLWDSCLLMDLPSLC